MADTPLWLNADPVSKLPVYSADVLRRNLSALMHQAGSADALGARAGVMPGGGDAVTLVGSTLSYHDAKAVIYPGPSASSTSGAFVVGLTGGGSDALQPQDANNPRKDIVVARVYDDDADSSGLREARFEYLPGIAATPAVEPPVPAGALRLAGVDVPISGGGSPTLTYNPLWTAAAGGVVPVRDATELPTVGLYEGLTVWQADVGFYQVWHNGAWSAAAPSYIARASNIGGTPMANSSWTPIPMNTGDFTDHFVVPYTGYWTITALASFDGNPTGDRACMLTYGTSSRNDGLGGTEVTMLAAGLPSTMITVFSGHLTAPNGVWLIQWQASGGTLNTNSVVSSRAYLAAEFKGGN